MESQPKNFNQLRTHFNNELVCFQYLEQQRWNGKPICPHCGSEHHSRTKTRFKHVDLAEYKDFRCKACDKKYTVLTGTIYESSKISLQIWFQALYLITAHKKGISSLQLASDLGVTQKTAWFMLHRLRELVSDTEFEILEGTISSDETYVGGKSKNKHKNKKTGNNQGRSAKDKTPVVGLMEENGKVVTFVVKSTDAETLHGIINSNVKKGSTVVTDAYRAYNGLGLKYKHVVVKHEDGKYVVDGSFSTNNVENFWSLFKRGIIGIYHYASPKHLQRYCEEFEYRYNNRKLTDIEKFEQAIKMAGNARLSYSDLIGKDNGKKENI